ncbi:class I SAM-dependent methyltransferase [Microbacterium sp.]|uniref:class I SAM-dependent methyltransferase n=1 Tax=Microbacterium sp. TaxID=51671 RepID=UPI003F9B356B
MSEWQGVGAAYAASYAALCAGTADAVSTALEPGRSRSLLDVGSGTGALAAMQADRGWDVTACEPEATMREIARTQHPALRVIDGGLPKLPFADSVFDAVTANFVLNHVPDPRAAAAEMARVSAPNGVLVATIWTVSPSWFWVTVCERAGLVPAAGGRLPADKDFERTASGFARMLRDGRWRAPEVKELTWTWHAPREALWTSASGGVATAGAFYLSLDERSRDRFRRAFDDLCDEQAVDGAIPLEHVAAVAVSMAG